MVWVSMKGFARFYATPPAAREALLDSSGGGGRDGYQRLKAHWKEHHVEDLDIGPVARGPVPLPPDRTHGYAAWEANYETLHSRYIVGWQRRQGNYYPVERVMLPFGDLRIRVDPEVGMRLSVPDRAPPWVLKLWLDQGAPTTDVLDAYLYLLGSAAAVGGWGAFTQLGVWNVRRDDIVSYPPRDEVADWISSAASHYLELKAGPPRL